MSTALCSQLRRAQGLIDGFEDEGRNMLLIWVVGSTTANARLAASDQSQGMRISLLTNCKARITDKGFISPPGWGDSFLSQCE